MTSQGSNAYIDDMSYQTESSVLKNEKSKVVEFFARTNVLVTGGTGFLGKLLVEKLLRTCPDITTLFLFVRSKKGKNSEERFKENFEDIVYDRLRQEQPNFLKKVVMIDGDITLEDLGLSPEVRQNLMSTNIIFHAAATVRFDEKLRVAANINVRSIKNLLMFARELPDLKSFVHISTAYSHCTQEVVDEKHYKPPIDAEKLLSLVDIFDDDQLERVTPIITGKWPNTYTLSKAIGENAILKYGDGLPVCIVRPSIVISTSKEPVAAWTNNMYGATGVVIASGMGLIRTIYCKREYLADVIPADYVISNVIVSAWEVAQRKSSLKLDLDSNVPADERIPIYNSVSSCQNPISWGEFMKANESHGFEVPSIKMFWSYMLILNRYLLLHNICSFFLHIVPAVLTDTILYIIGRKPMMLEVYRKVNKFSSVINFFSVHQWQFHNDNVMKLWKKLDPVDKELFNFNMENLNWDAYFYNHIRGLRVYLLNDPLETVDAARRKYYRLRAAHYTIATIVLLLGTWMLTRFLFLLWSFCPLSQ